MYIIRFEEENFIKTIKVCDYDSMEIIMKELEKKNIEYVIIKNKHKNIEFTLKCMLDFGGKNEE